jgi:hypothetical protein
MRAVFAVMSLFLGLLLIQARAEATAIVLASPQISFRADVDKSLADAIHAVVQDRRFEFLGGAQHFGWGSEHDYTNLIYQGDTDALDSFLTKLSRVKGLHVKIRLSADLAQQLGKGWWKDQALNQALVLPDGAKLAPPVPGWELVQNKQSPDQIMVWINLAAKDISVERLLEKWLVERAVEKTK